MSYSSLNEHEKLFIKLMRDNSGRYRAFEIFRDFCLMAACTLSNKADRLHFEERETMYMSVAKKYDATELQRFAKMLACIVESLTLDIHDSLGLIFMHEDFGSDWHGQFFTPFCVATLMTRLTMQNAQDHIVRRGFLTMSEPACGSGTMIIATASSLHDAGINYQQSMHVVTTDLDIVAVHMAYIQFSLLYIPAIVIHGNTLTLETMSHWATLAHVADDWDKKLAERRQIELMLELLRADPAPVAASSAANKAELKAEIKAPVAKEKEVADLAALGVQIVTQRREQLSLF